MALKYLIKVGLQLFNGKFEVVDDHTHGLGRCQPHHQVLNSAVSQFQTCKSGHKYRTFYPEKILMKKPQAGTN